MLGLPFELLLMVLKHCCGDYFADAEAFIDGRTNIMQVCRFWYDIVWEHGQFWSQYSFVPFKLAVDVRDWVSRFHTHFIDLTVYLDEPVTRRALRRRVVTHEGRMTVNETAVAAGSVAHLCRRLHVIANEVDALPLFISKLRRADGTRLQSLSIARIPGSGPNRTPFLSLPHDIFNSRLPCLRFIRLMAFVLSWINVAYYREAIIMVFHEVMDEAVIPTWEQLAAVLTCAVHLRRLSLRHFNCGPLLGLPRTIVLENLVELDMCFCGDFIPAFFAHCSLPSLTTFTASFYESDDIVQLLWCKSILARVTTFTLSGSTDRIPDIVQLFCALPMVERINLSDAGPSFLHALTPGKTSSRVVLCPRLVELSVGDCAIRAIADFVWARQVIHAPIHTLKVYDLPDSNVTTERWLANNVAVLTVDAPYDFGDGWVWSSE
ncbi:hypothetical protein C8R46DRAFT_1228641 [Mycena filopes]|nr:hypothetical protein C8R46DRAFT_1228641 [Mycena filopes]